ncbi:MAG: carboxypeptidase regulatory-like domain-containing protein, partial [Gammaproteobacteria bacterium]|nr:carboxypeptidase regulatory-like domain-containing protein [Gammaproteobacteria bacterium]
MSSPQVAAQDTSLAVDWLASKANPDGSYATNADVATSFQSTAEVLRAFAVLSETTQPGIPAALGFIGVESFNNTENLARKIIVNGELGNDVSVLLAELLASQNADGGFGEFAGFASTPLDTAFALEALATTGASQNIALERAVGFLRDVQAADGGFSLGVNNQGSVYITALVASALVKFSFDLGAIRIAEAAGEFLYASQIPGGGWASEWENALALLAVVPVTTDATRYTQTADGLRALQLSNGSWNNDVYATALLLRALTLVDNTTFPVDPSGATVIGRVVDAGSNLPMAGVRVSIPQLAGSEAITGADGWFEFIGIPPGDYTFNYAAVGYADAATAAVVQSEQTLHLGTVALNALPDTGFIAGFLIDAQTGQPVVNATIQLASG